MEISSLVAKSTLMDILHSSKLKNCFEMDHRNCFAYQYVFRILYATRMYGVTCSIELHCIFSCMLPTYFRAWLGWNYSPSSNVFTIPHNNNLAHKPRPYNLTGHIGALLIPPNCGVIEYFNLFVFGRTRSPTN